MAINERLELQESGLTEIKGMLEQVMQTMSMLQQGRVREVARSLSVHSQVEPAGFKGQLTPAPPRVGHQEVGGWISGVFGHPLARLRNVADLE